VVAVPPDVPKRETVALRPAPIGDALAVPGYEVVAEIGRGASTSVWRVRREGRDYALKVTRARDPAVLAAFRKEAAVLAALRHPRLPRVYEVGEVAGFAYLVAELVEGESLASVLGRLGPLPEPQTVALVHDVASALDAAHRAGIVHRDVTPANILIEPNGRARLIDFGLATVAGRPAGDATAGTLAYLAPEQTGLLRTLVDHRADLYALGAVCFECLTGRPPFLVEEAGDALRSHALVPAPRLEEVAPRTSPGLAALVASLLAKDPADRPASAAEVLGALSRLEPAPGRDPPVLGPLPDPEAPLEGRSQELAILARALEDAAGGAGSVALVTGEPGSGKTALLEELCRRAERRGLARLRTTGAELSAPYAALRRAVERWGEDVLADPARAGLVADLRARAEQFAGLLRGLSPEIDRLLAPRAPVGPSPAPDVVEGALAALLEALATAAGGALLAVDDAQELDAGSRRVLRLLARRSRAHGLAVLLASRDDPASQPFLDRLDAAVGDGLRWRLRLPALPDETVASLVARQLGASPPLGLVREVVLRAGGNPGLAVELVRLALASGALRPSFGALELDEDRLRALELPEDLRGVVLRRIDWLEPDARLALAAAAVVGPRFTARDVATLLAVREPEARFRLALAVRERLLRLDDDGFAFLSEPARRAVLESTEPGVLAALHRRRAAALEEGRRLDDPDVAYEVARHRLAAGPHDDPPRALAAARRAARVALAAGDAEEAYRFLGAARRVGEEHGLALDGSFDAELGATAFLLGRLEEAAGALRRALEAATDPLERARVGELLARVLLAGGDAAAAERELHASLRALGVRSPARALPALLASAGLLPLLLRRPAARPGEGAPAPCLPAPSPPSREALAATLLEAASGIAAADLRLVVAACRASGAWAWSRRAGPSAARARALSRLATILSTAGLWRAAGAVQRRALRAALASGDAGAVYRERLHGGVALASRGRSAEATGLLEQVLRERGPWLDPVDRELALATLVRELVLRGEVLRAAEWYAEGAADPGAPGRTAPPTALQVEGVALAASLGQATLAEERGEALARALGPRPPRGLGAHAERVRLEALVAAGALGEETRQLARAYRARRLLPVHPSDVHRPFWLARARAALLDAAGGEAPGRAARRRRHGAVLALRLSARTPLLRGHARAALAVDLVLSGHPRAALAVARHGERRALGLDALAVEAELALARARAIAALGHANEAERVAEQAVASASRHGCLALVRFAWPERALAPQAGARPHGSSRRRSASQGRPPSVAERRLAAILRVSAALRAPAHPDDLARIALDQILGVLGAERALLLVADPAGGPLRPHLARGPDGRDLREFAGYSTTAVERLRATGEPVVVTSTEDGVALGARSALEHGVRSILVAPIRLEGRLLGAVYLDNRLASRVFDAEDLAVLSAIAGHLGVALETARTTELSETVAQERRRLALAELLHRSVHEATRHLDPIGTLRSLCSTALSVLEADAAAVLLGAGADLELAATAGPLPALEAEGRRIPLGAEPELDAVLTTPAARSATVGPGGRSPLAELLGPAQSYAAVPLVEEGNARGVLLVVRAAGARFLPADVELLRTLGEQGATAWRDVERLAGLEAEARLDELCGINNRRHFFELATRALVAARRAGRPLSAMMVDLDHFKDVNDRYGHAVGDEVLRTAAARLAGTIRAGDLLGRYGGEEFVLAVEQPLAVAGPLADRLRRALGTRPFDTAAGPLAVSASVGVAELHPLDEDLPALLRRADQALYAAKRQGRDRTVLAPPPA